MSDGARTTAGGAALQVRDLRVAYGGIQAVKGVDLDLAPGELVAVIGANGAGKTTMLGALSGSLAGARISGTVVHEGQRIDGLAACALVRRRIAMVPEGRGIFARMSVHENLLVGAHALPDRADRPGIEADIARWFDTFPRLKSRARQMAGTLSGGEQQMLAIARALMSRPRLLLLDEPSMGLAPLMVGQVFELVRQVAASGITVLLVEQNARMALQTARRAYVMDSGRMVMAGAAAELLVDARVKNAYLGEH